MLIRTTQHKEETRTIKDTINKEGRTTSEEEVGAEEEVDIRTELMANTTKQTNHR